MKIKRFKLKNNPKFPEIIQNNEFLKNEIKKIFIEKPSEIVIFYDKNENLAASMYLWNEVENFENKKTLYIGNLEIFCKDLEFLEKAFEKLFLELKKESVEILIGPLNGNTWNKYRFVTERYWREPFLMEPVNDVVDVEIFKKIGFVSIAEYFSSIAELNDKKYLKNLSEKVEKVKNILNRKRKDNKKFKDFDIRQIKIKTAENQDLHNVLEKIYDLTIKAFKNNFLYSEIDKNTFLQMYEQYEEKLVKKYLKFAYLNDELIGFVFGMPDYLEMSYKGKVETIILKTIGVLPEFNGCGISYLLIDEFVKDALDDGYKYIIYALMYAGNVSKNIGLLLGEKMRKYELFKKEL